MPGLKTEKTMRIRTALAVTLIALSLTACAPAEDDGVATAGGDGADPSASATLSDDESALRFAQCMREQGIDMPDPDPDAEGFRVQLPAGVDPEAAKAATEACKQYMPGGGTPPKMDPEEIEKVRQYSQCMRDNGIEDFPEPDPETGGMMVDEGALDTQSAEFQAAEEACAGYRPQGPEGPEEGN